MTDDQLVMFVDGDRGTYFVRQSGTIGWKGIQVPLLVIRTRVCRTQEEAGQTLAVRRHDLIKQVLAKLYDTTNNPGPPMMLDRVEGWRVLEVEGGGFVGQMEIAIAVWDEHANTWHTHVPNEFNP